MFNSDFAIFYFYLCLVLLWIMNYVFNRVIVMNRRKQQKPKIQKEPDRWDWLIRLKDQPVEVTFDHKTFLVYDRKTDRWKLEYRVSEDFIGPLFGDCNEKETVLVETAILGTMRRGYKRKRNNHFGIKSPSSD